MFCQVSQAQWTPREKPCTLTMTRGDIGRHASVARASRLFGFGSETLITPTVIASLRVPVVRVFAVPISDFKMVRL